MAESIAAALEGRSRLLVFDNCEHVLDAAADIIEAIFAHSSTVTILATSREGLRLADEQLWPVPSLDVRAGADSAAATLFIDRAQAVSPGVSLTGQMRPTLSVEICRRLDGIPLAIELAASRMMSMTATEVRDRLDDRFRLLVGSRRGLERHQTLRHAVQWSYDLLDDDEKALLTRCSVFAGGFDLAGACAVAASDDELATLDLLDALVRKSLLVADRTSGRTRFSMLETIRQFAEEQLVLDREATRAHRARPLLRQARGRCHWHCGTVPGSARLTTGSPPSLRTFAPRFAGPPIMTTSTPPPPSPSTQHFSATSSNSRSQSRGPRNSSPHAEAVRTSAAGAAIRRGLLLRCGRTDDDFVGYAEQARAAIAGGQFDDVYEGIRMRCCRWL